jgi:DNA-binding response OmpR family regulator
VTKVLIVDDDPEIRTFYALLLQREGWEVDEAENGYDALSKARAQPPALVLLDVMMPELDGYEVCRRLRADPQTSDLTILMISAKATVTDRRNGIMAGANDFLCKTIGPRRLVAQIRTFLTSPMPDDGKVWVSIANT